MVVDRDVDPDLPKRFAVRAYPTLLILSPGDHKKLLRWSGFSGTPFLLEQFRESLARHRLKKDGELWDVRPLRPATVAPAGTCTTHAVPDDDPIGGIARVGDAVWVLHGRSRTLHELRLDDGKPGPATGRQVSLAHLEIVRDLTSDGEALYAASYGWTSGKPIYRIDPKTLAITQAVVTKENRQNRHSGTGGVARTRDAFFVLESFRRLAEVDPSNGEIRRRWNVEVPGHRLIRCASLAFDGTHLVTAAQVQEKKDGDKVVSRDRTRPVDNVLLFIDPKSGEVTRRLPLHYSIAAVECVGDTFLLAEQPERGWDVDHKPIRVFPERIVLHSFTPAGE